MESPHGKELRGLRRVPSSPSFEGRFGRLFGRLPVFGEDSEALRQQVQNLADAMGEATEPAPEAVTIAAGQPLPTGWGGDPSNPPPPPPPGTPDGDNPTIPAGYTYLGQFIDHDITFDPVSSLQRANDPDALVNFRTPKFDLDSLYGSGPSDDPFMYDEESPSKLKLLTGPVFEDDLTTQAGPAAGGEQIDLVRNGQLRALIGDPRNDENNIVSQLHLAFVRFHNQIVDKVVDEQGLTGEDLFKEAQRIVRWHYQWVVVHDYLKRTIGDELWGQLVRRDSEPGEEDGAAPETYKLRFYRAKKNAFMPLEFSVAAFRFGHSQVRPGYRLNQLVAVPTFVPDEQPSRIADLRGFRGLPPHWQIAWPNLFGLEEIAPQPSRLINTRLAQALFGLPGEPVNDLDKRSLGRRNLLKGLVHRLPAGEDVAEAMGVEPLSEAELKAASVDCTEFGFNGRTPLWFYVLAEAELRAGGEHLGPVGGRIVGETILGLLMNDRLSYSSVKRNWTPAAERSPLGDKSFDIAGLLKVAVPDRVARF